MKIVRNIKDIEAPFQGACVTIGNFDGVHLGHQQLFARVVEKAKKNLGTSIVVTFDPHPLAVLRPGGMKMISTWKQKEEFIRQAGIDILLVITFDSDFAGTSADDFVADVLVGRLGVKELVVGYDYAFGKGRVGDIAFLEKRGEQFGFGVEVVPPYYVEGEVVSSTRVRELVQAGKIALAGKLLGRPYQIRGLVKHGKQRGSTQIGFPTANLHFTENELVPKYGVYVVQVKYENSLYGGILNIGENPTFEDKDLVAETFIFDFNKDIYGDEITLFLYCYVRGEEKFSQIDELIEKIKEDVKFARSVLAERG